MSYYPEYHGAPDECPRCWPTKLDEDGICPKCGYPVDPRE